MSNDRIKELESKIDSLESTLESIPTRDQNNDNLEKETDSEGRLLNDSGSINAMNDYLQDLTLHEYQKVNNILEKDHRQVKTTIMDESLGSIINNTINFLALSVDGMYQKYNEAEVMDETPIDKRNVITKIKLYLMAFILFIRDDKHVIYLGILCIIVSIIIYFFNITTS